MSSKMQENEVSNYAGPPPAYHELNHDTGGENPGDQAGSSESSSRRRAGLFPAPPPIDAQQRTVTQGNRSPQNNPFSNTNRPANDMSGPSTSNPQQPPAGYAYSNINLDESNSARGLAGSAIQKGVRLAQKLNPLGHNSISNRDDGIEDVYLAVMGVTGAGKSSFIKMCTNKDVKIGHNLKSCTAFVEDFQIMYNDKVRLHLIDTPGFDDTHKSDTDVLRDIAAWLGTTYSQGILLSGIIYLHRISDPRMSGGAMRNLHMFKELCGKDCFQSVLLATTFWGSVDERQALQNENELKTTEEFWGEMLDLGCSYLRYTGNRASAWHIVDYMVQRRHPFLATIQKETVDGKLELNKTKAGRQLNADLVALEEKHIKKMRELEQSYLKAQEEQDQRSMHRIGELHDRLQKEIDDGKDAQADLVASLERINRERAEELEEYKDSINLGMKELVELRQQLDRYHAGSEEAEERNRAYQNQLKDIQDSIATVQRRQPGFLDLVGEWLDETATKIGNWWAEVFG